MIRIAILSLFPLLLLAVAGCRQEEGPMPAVAGPEGLQEIPPDSLLAGPATVEMDPYGLTPLAGRAIVRTLKQTQLEVQLLGAYPVFIASEAPAFIHEVMLLGFYPGRENVLIFKATDAGSGDFARDTVFVRTAPLPDFLPDIGILEKRETQMEPGWNLLELNLGQGRFFPLIFDPGGQVRWYMKLDFIQGGVAPFERLRNGNWLWANKQTVYESDMLGREIARWELPAYTQHHDLIEKPDGNLLVCVTKEGLDTEMDHIIELGRQSGAVVREWDLRQVLDVGRFDLIAHSYDWLHVNSVWYDESDEGLLLSARHQGIFKVSKDNRLMWILAPHQGWGAAGPDGNGLNTAAYLLTAVDGQGAACSQEVQQGTRDAPAFSWPWGQHACMILPGGNIFCFDNGWRKNFGDNAGYIRAVEYRVDPMRMQVEQVWEYGKARGAELYSHNVCDVDYLPATGNRLVCSGNIDGANGKQGRAIEVSYPEGEVVFEALIHCKNKFGGDIIYRAERLPLYPE